MKAYVEILSGVVRVGPDAREYGDEFVRAAAFSSIDGLHATLKGLNKEDDEHIDAAHVRAAMRAVAELGLVPVWVRLKNRKPRANGKAGRGKGAKRGGKIESGKRTKWYGGHKAGIGPR